MIIENSYPVTIDTGPDDSLHDPLSCGDCEFFAYVSFDYMYCSLFRERLEKLEYAQSLAERCARCLDVYEKKE